MRWLHGGAEDGAVVIADEQRKGRGRQGRAWYTPPGVAIAMSVVLYPPQKGLPQVTMLGALAIHDVLTELDTPNVKLKWPNDVRVNGRKISGVLPEAAWHGERLVGVCLGIGINVRVDFTGTELAAQSTSVEAELGRSVERAWFVARVLDRIAFWRQRILMPELTESWGARLDTLGQYVRVGTAEGMAESVDYDGALLIRDNEGNLHRVLAGDVALG